eukprot:CAMPEP_0172444996 /NCGR_PEP_ID=MMETSP1065-20121228/4992_1 /TAXON_ID=265537 /ORGANISM="Amphiprora paludosa, Strain CCMP125" /LENGTH=281 /DNA_ID=CAMNT_0013195779 /DNA_START=276 /DNA_END=1121 /DNA_ORIENTATION=+
MTYPSTKNIGVVTFSDDDDGRSNTNIQTNLTDNIAEIKTGYGPQILSKYRTCCECAFQLAMDLLDENEDEVGRQVTIVFLSDGICNEPTPNPLQKAENKARQLVNKYDANFIKVAVGDVTCDTVNLAVPETLGPCYESSNPADLNLNEIVGTKLISGTIEIDGDDQETIFPVTNPEFTADVKNETYVWSGLLGLGSYDVHATVIGQDAQSATPSSVTDTEISLFTVVDLTPPSITCPDNIDITSDNGSCDVVVTYNVVSNDNCPSQTVQLQVSLTRANQQL